MSNHASSNTPPSIKLSVRAADKIASLIAEENNFNLKLRVAISGGGCSGFKYGFTFDETVNDDDYVIKQMCSNDSSSVELLVDSISYQYLNEAEIDYTQDMQGAQFVIRNPNAKTTCGCGSSFSLEDDE